MIHGVLNVYKEKGYTSHDVVAKLRGIVKQKKIGHTGTLDPDAEGVLPVCFGKATKLCDLLTDKDKPISGSSSRSGDGYTGYFRSGSGKHSTEDLTNEKVENVIRSFEGEYGSDSADVIRHSKLTGKSFMSLPERAKK